MTDKKKDESKVDSLKLIKKMQAEYDLLLIKYKKLDSLTQTAKKGSFLMLLRSLVDSKHLTRKNRSALILELMIVLREKMIEWASRDDANIHSKRMKRVLDFMSGIDQEVRVIDQRYKDKITG